MLTRLGLGLLELGLAVAVLIPLVAVTIVVGWYLDSAWMIALFVVLVAAIAGIVTFMVRNTRHDGWI